MHVIGSAGVAVLFILATRNFCYREKIELPLNILVVVIFAGTLSTGALWEIFEFAIDRTGYFFAQPGLRDTMIDLLADALGALIALSAYATMGHCKIHVQI